MNYTEIETFLAVVECGSITEAANQLFVSQTTVSSRLRSLELELGVPLIERGKGIRGTKLTPFGSRLVPVAKKWSVLWQETNECLREERHQNLTILANTSIVGYILPEVITAFQSRYPDVYLTVKPLYPEECQRQVKNGMADMAFVSRSQYSAEVAARPLYTDKYVFLSSVESGYPDVVHPSELPRNQEIYVDWNLAFIQWHSYWFGDFMPKLFSGSTEVMACALQVPGAWSVVPISVARALQQRSHMKISELREAPDGRTGYLLHRNADGLSRTQQNFLEVMRSVLMEKDIRWIFQG